MILGCDILRTPVCGSPLPWHDAEIQRPKAHNPRILGGDIQRTMTCCNDSVLSGVGEVKELKMGQGSKIDLNIDNTESNFVATILTVVYHRTVTV